MQKLAKILAASVGAGFLIGAGFRLGEAVAASPSAEPSAPRPAAEPSDAIDRRIAAIEKELSRHSAELSELRECSLRTELSLQKLLGGIDRLISAQSAGGKEPAAHAGQTQGGI